MTHLNAQTSRSDLLAAIGRGLSGSGIEFRAGAHPFPIGKSCKVRYADRNSNAQLRDRQYFGGSPLTSEDIRADFETMEGIPFEPLYLSLSAVMTFIFTCGYMRLHRLNRLCLPEK